MRYQICSLAQRYLSSIQLEMYMNLLAGFIILLNGTAMTLAASFSILDGNSSGPTDFDGNSSGPTDFFLFKLFR